MEQQILLVRKILGNAAFAVYSDAKKEETWRRFVAGGLDSATLYNLVLETNDASLIALARRILTPAMSGHFEYFERLPKPALQELLYGMGPKELNLTCRVSRVANRICKGHNFRQIYLARRAAVKDSILEYTLQKILEISKSKSKTDTESEIVALRNFFEELSSNPHLPLSFVLKHPELPWEWSYLTANRNITLQEMLAHLELPWVFTGQHGISDNPSLTMEDIGNHPEIAWNWEKLSENPAFIWGMIKNFPDLPWDYRRVSRRKDIPLKDILQQRHLNWNWSALSSFIPLGDIIAHPELKWSYASMSSNPTLTIDFILQHMSTRWKWPSVSGNRNIKLQDILENMDLPWSWSVLTRNPSVVTSINTILDNPDLPWVLHSLLSNENIGIGDIYAHPELFSIWSDPNLDQAGIYFSLKRTDLTLEDVLNNLERNWDWYYLTHYFMKNGMQTIIDHPDLPWSWNTITESSTFTLN